MRDAEAMRGLPDGSAGLPRRYAPRNDNGGDGNGRGWETLRISVVLSCAVIASPSGRGNPHTLCHCEEGLEEN